MLKNAILDRTTASSGTVSRFETDILTQDENIDALAALNSTWVSGAVSRSLVKKVILDIDSSEPPVHDSQEGSAHPPPREGEYEETYLEFVKDGDIKQGGFRCKTTVPGQPENTRPGGDMERSIGEHAAESSQPA